MFCEILVFSPKALFKKNPNTARPLTEMKHNHKKVKKVLRLF